MKKFIAFSLCMAFLMAAVSVIGNHQKVISQHEAKASVEQVAIMDASVPVIASPATKVTVIIQNERTALGIVATPQAMARPPTA